MTVRMKNGGVAGMTGTVTPWRSDVPAKRRADPETCHCGAPALYRHPTKHNVGYCKAHKAEAVAASTATSRKSEL
jgi:hypothetical protein